MSLLLARSTWFKAALTKLGSAPERQIPVIVEDGPSKQLPDNWRSLAAWVANPPNAFLKSLVIKCEEFRQVAEAIANIRNEMACGFETSTALRDNFGTYFEGLLEQPWLTENGVTGGRTWGIYGSDGEVTGTADEWILSTMEPPLARLDGLITLAEKVCTAGLGVHKVDESWSAETNPDGVEERKDKRKGGRPPNDQLPLWKAETKRLRDSGRSYQEIVEHLYGQFAIKRSTATLEGWIKELRERA